MAKVTRSYRIRTYPNGAQRRLRDRWFGAYRWLWNTALEMRSAAQCLRDQDAAFRNFYSGRARYPRFKRKSATGSLRFQDAMLAPPALLAVHPLGKSPVITDGDLTVAESGAIVEYLIDKYGAGRLIPRAGTPERLRCTYRLHHAEGSAMPPLLIKLIFDRVASTPMPWPFSAVSRRITAGVQSAFIGPQLARHLDFMESELSARPWFAGAEFTAAACR